MPTTDSDAVAASIPLLGVWLHDPENEESTAHGFFFGSAQRSDGYDGMGVGTYYVGRSAPVYEFGEFEARSVDATIDVAYGETYADDLARLRAFAESKITLWYRDNRGRALFGTITAFKVNDAAWGMSVSLTFTESHHDVTMVSA
jgi:hypothetical protein